MTIFHIGTEDIHFVQGGTALVSTATGTFRSEWSRCGLRTFNGASFWRAPLDTMSVSTSEFWLTCQMYRQDARNGGAESFRFLNDGFWRLRLQGAGGKMPVLQRHNDDLTTTTLATGILPWVSSVTQRVDIYVNLDTGKFRLYIDRGLSISAEVDLTNGEYDAITHYDLTASYLVPADFDVTQTGHAATFSEVCWRSDDTRKMIGVRAVWPYGDGHTQDWTGVKADVDEIVVDETDANYTDTPDLLQQYTTPPMPSGLTGNVIIGAVMVGARMATNPTDEAVNIRTGGNDYNSTAFDTDGAIEDEMNIWETNPDTSNPFTLEEVNDPEFNIGVASV